MKKIKAVIFDLDGTLANTLPLCISAFRQSVEPLINKKLSDEAIISTFGPSEEGTIMALAPDFYSEGIRAYLLYYEQLHAMCDAPFEGIKLLLERLQANKIRVAMVTGKGKYSTAISLKYFDLTHYFEFIETGSPAGARKAEGIKAVLEQLDGILADEVIYVGNATSDIIASRQNNIRVVAAAWAATAEYEKLAALSPDQLFFTVEDFSAWLLNNIV